MKREFSSSVRNLNAWKQYSILGSDPSEIKNRMLFSEFNEDNSSLIATTIVYLFLLIAQIPIIVSSLEEIPIAALVIELLLVTFNIAAMACLYIYSFYHSYDIENSYTLRVRSYRHYLRGYIIIMTTLLYAAVLLKRMFVGECDNNHLLTRLNCNPLNDVEGIPYDTSLALMLLPLIFSLLMRESHQLVILLSWLIVIVTLVLIIAVFDISRAVLMIFFYLVMSLVIIMENYRYSYHIFLLNLQLKTALKQNEENADQLHAQEMRHMIANVAHDLKTPLTSFLSGIEYIADVSGDCLKKIVDERSKQSNNQSASTVCHELEEYINSIQNCIRNIRNTNSFMLMTINRCIDYTKASKGMKLRPKLDTIDLRETLQLPLNCMKDMQSAVDIKFEPISQNICSHIITDKQWLQENVLCLLSNAVKYSNHGGLVTLGISMVTGDKLAELMRKNQQLQLENNNNNNNNNDEYPLSPTGSAQSHSPERFQQIYSTMTRVKNQLSPAQTPQPHHQHHHESRNNSVFSTYSHINTFSNISNQQQQQQHNQQQHGQQHSHHPLNLLSPDATEEAHPPGRLGSFLHSLPSHSSSYSLKRISYPQIFQTFTHTASNNIARKSSSSSSAKYKVSNDMQDVEVGGEQDDRLQYDNQHEILDGAGQEKEDIHDHTAQIKVDSFSSENKLVQAPMKVKPAILNPPLKCESSKSHLPVTGLSSKQREKTPKSLTINYNELSKVVPIAQSPVTSPSQPGRRPSEQDAAANTSFKSNSNTQRETTTNFYLKVEVEDTGIGLSEEAMEHLFSPFKQAQRLAGGTGLGLYSLAKRVEALRGHYGVEARRDGQQGSLFWFSIPYRPDKAAAGTANKRKSIFNRKSNINNNNNNNNNNTIKNHRPQQQISQQHEEQQQQEQTSGQEDQEVQSLSREQLLAAGQSFDMQELISNTIHMLNLQPSVSSLEDSHAVNAVHDSSQLRGVGQGSTSGGVKTTSSSASSATFVTLDILIVDDSPSIVKMTSMMLRRLGHRITIAENGASAIEKIRAKMLEKRAVLARYFESQLSQVVTQTSLKEDSRSSRKENYLLPHQRLLGGWRGNANYRIEEESSSHVRAESGGAGNLEEGVLNSNSVRHWRGNNNNNNNNSTSVRNSNEITVQVEESHKDTTSTAISSTYTLENINALPFDVVLMDLQMPVMDGLEATRRIRRLEQTFYQEILQVIQKTLFQNHEDEAALLVSSSNKSLSSNLRKSSLGYYLIAAQHLQSTRSSLSSNCTSVNNPNNKTSVKSGSSGSQGNNSPTHPTGQPAIPPAVLQNLSNLLAEYQQSHQLQLTHEQQEKSQLEEDNKSAEMRADSPMQSSTQNLQAIYSNLTSVWLGRQLVIGVSANSDDETMQEALQAGVDAFMGKPFSLDTFYDTYERLKNHQHFHQL